MFYLRQLSAVCVMLFISAAFPAYAEVPYITGGIGGEERAKFELLRDDYNLQIKTADGTGHYLADVEVVISNANGLELLDAVTDGPYFYASLAAGKYTATARFGSELLTQSFSIVEAAPMREVMFRFKGDYANQ